MSTNLNKLKAVSGAWTQIIQNYLKLGAAETPKYINKVKKEVIYKKANDLNNFYTRILGLDEVKAYQDRVVMLQEKLLGVQEQRRNIGQKLTEIRKRSTELQDQIHKVNRSEDLQKFLDLMREETEVLKLEKDINTNFLECDRLERDVFTAFTNAVRDSHEKQRAQLEYTKYFGLILSIVGSFLTFCYSSFRKQELKNFIEKNLDLHYQTSQPIVKQLLNNSEKQVETSVILETINNNYNAIVRVLNETGFREFKDSNKVLVNSEDGSAVPDIVPDRNSILLYSCIAVAGYIVLHKLFG